MNGSLSDWWHVQGVPSVSLKVNWDWLQSQLGWMDGLFNLPMSMHSQI